MKKLITLIVVASLVLTIQAQDITNTPGTNGDFVITSTTGGILIPRLTFEEMVTMQTPIATGLMVYQTNHTPGFYHFDGQHWVENASTYAIAIDDLTDAQTISTSSYYLGTNSGLAAGAGDYNTAIGFGSLRTIGSGSNNTALGSNAGASTGTGSYNIIIGVEVDVSSATVSNELNIGDAIYATGLYGTTAKVGIGNTNTAPNSTLQVGGSFSLPIRTGGTTTLTATDYTYIITTTSAFVTLPTAVGIIGRIYIIKRAGVGNGVILPNGSETIDGGNLIGLITDDIKKVQSDGSNWWIIGSN